MTRTQAEKWADAIMSACRYQATVNGGSATGWTEIRVSAKSVAEAHNRTTTPRAWAALTENVGAITARLPLGVRYRVWPDESAELIIVTRPEGR